VTSGRGGEWVKGRGEGKMKSKRQQTGVTLTMEEIRSFVFRLPPSEFIQLADEVRERAETIEMTRLAETGFAEWDEPGEGIYDHLADESPAR
jgi:hypothetical protein